MNVAEHLEHHLGPMERGWSSSSLSGVHVCLFRDRPFSGVTTLATLGLSNTELVMSAERTVRQELLLAIREDTDPDRFARILLHAADALISTGRALLRGDVIPLDEKIADGVVVDALYASLPVVFPEGLATLKDSVPATVVVWLIALQPEERAFIESSGWSAFEDRLEAADPDVFDLSRRSIV